MTEETFTSDSSWTVPDDVEEIDIECHGGDGGDGISSWVRDGEGGDGGEASATLQVSSGDVIYMRFGGGGSGGNADDGDGGDGGDHAAVRYGGDSEGDTILVGGGGGGGGAGVGYPAVGDGGDGGGEEGEDGEESDRVDPGEGGTQTEGGTGGGPDWQSSEPGSKFSGGDGGGSNDAGGGGGGSGWYGGGGGLSGREGNNEGGSGGGGGSGYVDSGHSDLSSTSNDVGGSDPGSAYVSISYETVPNAPTNASIDRTGFQEIDISWSENTDGGEPDWYRIEGGSSSYSYLARISAEEYTHTGLEQHTDYSYRIRAENGAGVSSWSYTGGTTTGGAPTSFTIDSVSGNAVDVNWSNPSGDLDEVRIYGAEAPGSSVDDYNLINTTTGTSFSHDGLVNGRSYYYRLTAVYFDGETDPSGEIDATTDLPAPAIIGIEETDNREITVEWTVNDDNPDGDQSVRRNTDGSIEAGLDPSIESYADIGLLDGKSYEYRVVRDTGDAEAESGWSSPLITALPPVENLTVEGINGRFATLLWTDPSNNSDFYELLLREDADGEYSQDGTNIDAVGEDESVTQETTELLDGQLYEATVRTHTADTSVKEADD